MRRDTVQDDVDEMVVHHLDIDIASIDFMQAFLDSTWLFETSDLLQIIVRLIRVTIVLSDGVANLFPTSIPVSICFPQFQCLSISI